MRLVYTGIVGGLVTSLFLTLPLYLVLPGMFAPAWPSASPAVGLAGLLLAALTVIASGYVGTRWTWTGTSAACLIRGAIVGGIVGALAWAIIGSSAAGVVAHEPIWSRGLRKADNDDHLVILLGEAIIRTFWLDLISFGIVLSAGLSLGAFGGLLYALYRSPSWDMAPRPMHRTILQAIATTLLCTTSLATLLCTIVFTLLEQRLYTVQSETGHQFTWPPWGVMILPWTILFALMVAAGLWNWWLIAQRRVHPVPALRTSTVAISAVTALIGVGTWLLLILINPAQLPLIAIGVGSTTTAAVWAWRRKPAGVAAPEIFLLRAQRWAGYLALGWLIIAIISRAALLSSTDLFMFVLTLVVTGLYWGLVVWQPTQPIRPLRTSRCVLSITIVLMAVGTSLLYLLMFNADWPDLPLIAIGFIGLVGATAAGILPGHHTKPGNATVPESLPLRPQDWIDYLAVGWLISVVISKVAFFAPAVSTLYGAMTFIGVLTAGAHENMPTIEGAIRNIFLGQAATGFGINPAIVSFYFIGMSGAESSGTVVSFFDALLSPIITPLVLLICFVGYRRVRQQALSIALVERDAQQLKGYGDLRSIAAAHRELAVTQQLDGPASAMLRSLSRVSQDIDAALQQESHYNRRLALGAVEDRLDALARELARSNESYATLFRPVASSWRHVVADQVRELAQVVEARQEIDSPYIIGIPLSDRQEIFVGRTDVTARIEHLLLDRRRPPLLLYGQRRMGKTSLLNNLGRLLPSAIVPLFVDLQGAPTQASDHAGLLYNIVRRIVNSAQQQRGLILPTLAREALAADPFTAFDEWLDTVEQALEQNTALLLLDEFEALDSALSAGRFDEERVLGMLRNLIQHRPKFKVLLAGSHTLDELQRWSSYLINVQLVKLDYLKVDEARQLIEHPVKGFALSYEPEATQRVLDLTRGHPFLLQLLCAEIVALKNEQAPDMRRLARLADVEAAVPEALQSGSLFFADIVRNQIDADGRALLHVMTNQGEGAIVGREAMVEHSGQQLDQTLTLLQRRDLIEAVNGGYRFQVELIRRWFVDVDCTTRVPQ